MRVDSGDVGLHSSFAISKSLSLELFWSIYGMVMSRRKAAVYRNGGDSSGSRAEREFLTGLVQRKKSKEQQQYRCHIYMNVQWEEIRSWSCLHSLPTKAMSLSQQIFRQPGCIGKRKATPGGRRLTRRKRAWLRCRTWPCTLSPSTSETPKKSTYTRDWVAG